MDQQFNPSEWSNEEAPVELSMTEMDAMVKRVQEAEIDRDKHKKILEGFQAAYDSARESVLKALVAANKKNYSVAGVGLVSVTNTLSFQTPKTMTDKKAIFDYIANKYGADTLLGLLSINSQTLGSFCRKEVELAADPGFKVPGIGAPTNEQRLSFRKEKV